MLIIFYLILQHSYLLMNWFKMFSYPSEQIKVDCHYVLQILDVLSTKFV